MKDCLFIAVFGGGAAFYFTRASTGTLPKDHPRRRLNSGIYRMLLAFALACAALDLGGLQTPAGEIWAVIVVACLVFYLRRLKQRTPTRADVAAYEAAQRQQAAPPAAAPPPVFAAPELVPKDYAPLPPLQPRPQAVRGSATEPELTAAARISGGANAGAAVQELPASAGRKSRG